MKKRYEIDSTNFSNREEFYDEISTKLIPGREWGRNLDAFNDILNGGFGTPEEGFVLVWRNSNISRRKIGADFTTFVDIIKEHGDIELMLE